MKLFVAGCSFSDYTKVEKVYGEILAESLGCEYVHEAIGCGSNWRSWRKITGHIMNGNLTSDDLLIMQYTRAEREEFWSSFPQPARAFTPKFSSVDKYSEGSILRFKTGAYEWQNNPEECEFFKTYEKNFVNIRFDEERFRVHNFMFQNMLLQKNIRTIFIRSHVYNISISNMLPEFLATAFTEPVRDLGRYRLSPDDWGHLNQEGHEVYAEWLKDHIIKLKNEKKL